MDTVQHPSATWEAASNGSVFYRRQQLYMLHGKLPSLDDYLIAGCRNGGPIGMFSVLLSRIYRMTCDIALMRDASKLVALGSGRPPFTKSQIQVYSPAGESLLLFSVDILHQIQSSVGS